jgi:glycerol uptake facilitator-like aquaporin
MDVSLFRKWIVEFIGTFFLVYVIGCVSLQDHVLLGPLAIGASLMVMIFAGGHISGALIIPRSRWESGFARPVLPAKLAFISSPK